MPVPGDAPGSSEGRQPPMERAKERERQPMQEAELIAAIDDADNRSYGSNLSNCGAF
jgi:hypothetical protein